MSWICPQDGIEVTDGTNRCSLCGFVRFPAVVSLISDATNKELHIRISTVLGRSVLASLGDPEDRFLSSEQLKIEKRPEQGGWAILSLPSAVNPFFLNGAPIDASGALLSDGDKLSIKGKYFHLTVRVLM